MKYIDKIGLEIEGGWFAERSRMIGIKTDMSVTFKRTSFKNRYNIAKHLVTGECASAPLPSIEEVSKWINSHWPDKKNKTCGFHIHVSFKNDYYYNILMKEEFYKFFLVEAEKFAHAERMSKDFFNRLKGLNNFCRREFKAASQFVARSKVNDRYCHLNYCRSLRGTIENRLPCGTMPKGKAVKTVLWFMNLLEDYIEKNVPKENRIVMVTQKEKEGIPITSVSYGNILPIPMQIVNTSGEY